MNFSFIVFAENLVTVNGVRDSDLSAPSMNQQFAYDEVETCKNYTITEKGKVSLLISHNH